MNTDICSSGFVVPRKQLEFPGIHAACWSNPVTWPHTVVRLHEAATDLMSVLAHEWLHALKRDFTALNWVSNPQSKQAC